MIDPMRDLPASSPRASLHLDGGCGCQTSTGAVELSERGLRFTGPWHFGIGTQLKVAVNDMHPRLGQCHMQLEGIVVWCQPTTDGQHETTVLFLDFPDEIRTSLREFSHMHTALR